MAITQLQLQLQQPQPHCHDHDDGVASSSSKRTKSLLKWPEHDWRVLLTVAVIAALNSALWRITASPDTSAITALCALAILSPACFIIATITHNTLHVRLFNSRGLNTLFHLVLTLGFGHPVETFVSGHNLSHHRYTQLKKDFMRTSKMKYKLHFLNLLLFFPTVSKSIAMSDFKFMRFMRVRGRRIWTEFKIQLIVLIIAHIFLLYSSSSWKQYLCVWYLPRVFASVGITCMNMLQHDGCDIPTPKHGHITEDTITKTSSQSPPSLNTARNFTGKFLNFMTFNNGYHSIHHLQPYAHWSTLPALHAKLIAPFIHPSLNQDNMAVYMYKTFVNPGVRVWYDGTCWRDDRDHFLINEKKGDIKNEKEKGNEKRNEDEKEEEEWMDYPPGVEEGSVGGIVKDILADMGDAMIVFGRVLFMPGFGMI